jgi:hypothetical protein
MSKIGQIKVKIYFSDIFDLAPSTVEKYGALDVSLINDLPFFVDPFHLFHSEKDEYQALHDHIIHYLAFLRDEASSRQLSKGLISSWFTFPEIKQNWLGFSKRGNNGRGLGPEFASSLHANLRTVFESFGKEQITAGTHLEKLCLMQDGVGKDHISDFATNLIKDYLCEFTQEFASKYLKPSQRKRCAVEKASFDFGTKAWMTKMYDLPYFNGDYVLLTPRDMLTKDESWISRAELVSDFSDIVDSVSNDVLRSQLNQYVTQRLDAHASKKDRDEVYSKAIEAFPEIIEWYIRSKENDGDQAADISDEKITEALKLFVMQVKRFADLLFNKSAFYDERGDSLVAARRRVLFMKDVIENNDGYKIFYVNGYPLKREEDLQILYRLTWFATVWDVNREPNNGRGPADYTVSMGALDKSVVEMKLASNSKLKQNLKHQVDVYKKANSTKKGLKVILYFSKSELNRVRSILEELRLSGSQDVILIDASKETKVSASNVTDYIGRVAHIWVPHFRPASRSELGSSLAGGPATNS